MNVYTKKQISLIEGLSDERAKELIGMIDARGAVGIIVFTFSDSPIRGISHFSEVMNTARIEFIKYSRKTLETNHLAR